MTRGFPKKLLVFLSTFLLFFSLSSRPSVLADGIVIPPPNYQVYETDQKAVVWYDGGTETMVLSITFRGDAQNFAWIVPVPSFPQVDKGQDSLFTNLSEFTTPKSRNPVLYEKGLNFFGLGGMESQPAVIVWETKKVDFYDVKVISSNDSTALTNWFVENGFPYPYNSSYILDSYINHHWFFVTAKISTDALGPAVAGNLQDGHATPLKITFYTEKIVYPLRISSIMTQETYSPVPTMQPETDWKTFKNNLYTRIYTGEKTWDEARSVCLEQGADLASISNKAENDFVTKLCGKGNTCRLGHTNPGGYCQKPYVNWVDGQPFTFENWAPGEPEFACGEDCLDINGEGLWNNEWCDNHWKYQKYVICKKPSGGTSPLTSLSRPIYPSVAPQPREVGILLYIFANHKKEIPGFETQYAAWVNSQQIKKFAQDDVGNPWIEANKKMYLTKLYRYLPTSLMTEDLFPQDAENNNGVNTTPSFFDEQGKVIIIIVIPLLMELGILLLIWYKRKWVK